MSEVFIVRFFDQVEFGPNVVPVRHLVQGNPIDPDTGNATITFDQDPRFLRIAYSKIPMIQLVPLTAVSSILMKEPASRDDASPKGHTPRA